MKIADTTSEEAQPIAGAVRDQLLEPFITATCAALHEMASTDVVVQATFRATSRHGPGCISAVMELTSAFAKTLVLSFPKQTAAALAGRILAGATTEVDENLIRDCVGEIGNVIAGQAKALLADTPYRFAFALPEVLEGTGAIDPQEKLECLAVAFSCDQREFTLRLLLKVDDGGVNREQKGSSDTV